MTYLKNNGELTAHAEKLLDRFFPSFQAKTISAFYTGHNTNYPMLLDSNLFRSSQDEQTIKLSGYSANTKRIVWPNLANKIVAKYYEKKIQEIQKSIITLQESNKNQLSKITAQERYINKVNDRNRNLEAQILAIAAKEINNKDNEKSADGN